MDERELNLSDCCTKCPHFDEFNRSCTHELKQTIIKEIAEESSSTCPIFPRVRTQSMQELERKLSP